ncbi:MAG: phosphoadenylyl-sulfate reductase [Alphaproteobacteria bacterium]|nr:phosphoadenylyl-sulfate reductase [Alphaproteobacteria bacterium]
MALVDLKTATRSIGAVRNAIEVDVAATPQERTAVIVDAVLNGDAISVPFAKFSDGRGFSVARLLRSEHGFRGEIRATGHVIPDQALHLLRSGFDTVELTGGRGDKHWSDALASYSGAYQRAQRNPLELRREASLRQRKQKAAAGLGESLSATASLAYRIGIVAESVPGRLAFSTSLGKEDQAVLHAIVASGVEVDVFTLDTGRHFPETLKTLKATEEHFGIKIQVMEPEAKDIEELIARDGEFGFRTSVEARKRCCEVRKVIPLNRALKGAAAWITGLRREQSAGRANVPFASWNVNPDLYKINPLADWSEADLEAYIRANNIPVNPLHAEGFASIGCQPCTRAVAPGEDLRAGRWWWENEDGKECGLHNRPRELEVA